MPHGVIPPPDEAAHEDSVLLAEIAEVNTVLSRYVLRLLDVDAGRAAPLTPDEERTVRDRVAGVVDKLRDRAERRELNGAHLRAAVGGD